VKEIYSSRNLEILEYKTHQHPTTLFHSTLANQELLCNIDTPHHYHPTSFFSPFTLNTPTLVVIMVTWNAQNDARLLSIILQVHNLKVDYTKCAEQFGQEATGQAIRERIRKILRDGGGREGAGSRSVTPAPSPRKRRNQKVTEGGITKKRGGKKVKSTSEVKSEDDEEDNV
jgi:hypothetical protein